MTYTVIGVLADRDGIARNSLQRSGAWSGPAAEFRREQPRRVPIDSNHDGREIGEIVYLERNGPNLWAIGEVDGIEPAVNVKVGEKIVAVPTDFYWSAERTATHDDRDILLESVAIVASTARVAARPLLWFDGDLGDRGSWLLNKRTIDTHLRGIIERAGEARHRHGQPLMIRDHHGQSPAREREPEGVMWLRDEHGNEHPVGVANARPGLVGPPAWMT